MRVSPLFLLALGCGPAVVETLPEPIAEADTDVDTDTDTDTDTDVDTDTDADADTEPPGPGGVMLTEICDHPDNANAKYIELFNGGSSTVDVDGWTVRRYANGGTDFADAELGGFMAPGQVRVIALGEGFDSEFGFGADQYDGAISGNGNDVYELHNGQQTVDIYGFIGVDGDGEAWDYADSVATRNSGINIGSAGFNVSQWTITSGLSNASPGVR